MSADLTQIECLAVIKELLQQYGSPRIKNVSFDGDNDSAEIILKFGDSEFVIRASDLRYLE